MIVKTLSPKDNIQDLLLSENIFYLLLETTILLDALYEQQRDKYIDIPPTLDIKTVIANKDKYALSEFIWEDTKFDDVQEQGPILVKIEKNSPLVDVFLKKWQKFNCGILIVPHKQKHPSASFKIITDHLRAIIMVKIEGIGKVRFRLQEPRKLSGVLTSFDEGKQEKILGPIKQLYWIENCATQQTAYQAINPSNQGIYCGVFLVSNDEKKKIDDFELDFFKCEIIAEVLSKIKKNPNTYNNIENITEEKWPDFLDKGFQIALNIGFLGKEVIYTFLIYSLYYSELMKSPDAVSIYKDKKASDHSRMYQMKALVKREKGDVL